MIFKQDSLKEEFESRSPLLKDMARYFEECSQEYGVEPVVTRVLEAICGSSGVHEAGRAIDFRSYYPSPVGYSSLYSAGQIEDILRKVNAKYPRKDKRLTLIHHSFSGGPLHFHLQQGTSLNIYEDDIKAKYGTT